MREMVINNETMSLSERSARSQIEDADFAESSSVLARTKVLQNSTVGLLSQLSQITGEAALALLRG